MSSAVQSPQPSQASKQWWASKPSASRIPSASFRPSKSPISAPATPITTVDERGMRAMSKGSKKFNTLASVMGFKSKRSHPMIDIPSGPVSPPLPLQNPPPQNLRSPRSRPTTLTSPASYTDPMSPVDSSIYTIPSSDEAFEATTPSDQLSRHRTSYQPSLFTFAEQQDHTMPGGLNDNLRYPYDARRISVMSDPSIIDPHMSREHSFNPSRGSGSSFLQPDYKSTHGSILIGISHTESMDSSEPFEINREGSGYADIGEMMADNRVSTESRKRDHRFSDTGIPSAPNHYSPVSASSSQGIALRKYPSANASVVSSTLIKTKPRSDSLFTSHSNRETSSTNLRIGRERMGSLRSNNGSMNGLSPTTYPRVSPVTRPKAASVSAGSYNATVNSRDGARLRPSVNTSLSRNGSIAPGVINSATEMIHRQPSTSRMRNVPPSRVPPPRVDLPPTPASRQPPSPLTFSANQNASASSLINSFDPATGDDPSILAFESPSPSSSSASSVSLCFARPGQRASPDSPAEAGMAHYGRDYPWTTGDSVRSQKSSQSGNRHDAKASISSGHTLMSAFGVRNESHSSRVLRRSTSQQSIPAQANGTGRDDGSRVESVAGSGSTTLLSEEGSTSVFGSVGRLRKQRSMHNTRAAGGSLALPPLPQQLRHANSFNVSGEETGNGKAKGEGNAAKRPSHSSTPASAINSTVNTPTTPQAHKKRLLFSSHGRERRDSNAKAERDKLDSQHSEANDKKKSHAGLGLFTGHFSPVSSGHGSFSRPPAHEFPREEKRISYAISEDIPHPQSPSSTVNLLNQHILPPEELFSQMEALADVEEPSSPPQFSLRSLGSEGEDEWSLDNTSLATTDKEGVRSRVSSLGAKSATSLDWSEEQSIISPSTRVFASATSSIHTRLQNDRPSTTSRLAMRSNANTTSSISSGNGRPSTAEPISTLQNEYEQNEVVPCALPPPPRRKGVVMSPQADIDSGYIQPTSPSPSLYSHNSTRMQRYQREGGSGLQRLASIETISPSSHNPSRASVLKKPSFLDISDNLMDFNVNDRNSMASVPEDSFLILEHGKDSLDISRYDEYSDGY